MGVSKIRMFNHVKGHKEKKVNDSDGLAGFGCSKIVGDDKSFSVLETEAR